MASQKELFKLIKSLEKNEKQAISIEGKKKNNPPKYLILYSWLESWGGEVEDYNREEVVKAIAKKYKATWSLVTLQTAENTLYDKIIDALSYTQLGKSPITTINQQLSKADVLKNKGFYKRSLKVLTDALEEAYRHQKHSLIVEIIPRKIDVILLTEYEGRREQVERSYRKLREATNIIQEEANFRSLNVRLIIQYQESRKPSNIPAALKEDFFSLTEKNFPTNGSFFSQYYYYSTQAIWANLHKKPDQAAQYQKKVVDLWLQNDLIRTNKGQLYLTQLANLANYTIAARNFKAAQEVIELLQNFSTKNPDEEAEKWQNLLFYQQYLLLNENKFEEARALVPDITRLLIAEEVDTFRSMSREKRISKAPYKRVNPSRLYNFYYNTLITLLLCHQYEQANDWLVRLDLLCKAVETRKDIQQVIRILQLIINYGLGSSQFSSAMFENLYKKKDIVNNMSPYEAILLDFFKVMTRTEAKTERRDKHFQKLLDNLENLDDQDKKVVGYEDVILWIKSILSPPKA